MKNISVVLELLNLGNYVSDFLPIHKPETKILQKKNTRRRRNKHAADSLSF